MDGIAGPVARYRHLDTNKDKGYSACAKGRLSPKDSIDSTAITDFKDEKRECCYDPPTTGRQRYGAHTTRAHTLHIEGSRESALLRTCYGFAII